ncbi:MAG: hypothetical protein GFH27_549291n5 [Chloroflexi bacterium AL-W]|nr:hypothetical protein [Chloroflexi bacterium AL-N1]NOK67528.1 hypothetical protein [Chloroflexi bacterium AL-N10]NOK74980.1 hypothetical protein [Chloroflexi bacterium AL-N5]NOK81767.1 hypothetical protein [Chloroflexi bacterium AL-W]NOK89613.1 hypothetical protein [Chloroflexi bacterium AL-N15]
MEYTRKSNENMVVKDTSMNFFAHNFILSLLLVVLIIIKGLQLFGR